MEASRQERRLPSNAVKLRKICEIVPKTGRYVPYIILAVLADELGHSFIAPPPEFLHYYSSYNHSAGPRAFIHE